MNMRKLCAGLASSVLVGTVLSAATMTPAQADPSGFTPDATTDIVGSGSDTIEGVMNSLADGMTVNGTTIDGYNKGRTSGRLASWDALNKDGLTDQITPREGAPLVTRPKNSGGGKDMLRPATNVAAFNFARSSSTLSSAEITDKLVQFPFAVDGLRMAVSSKVKSNAPATLTFDQIYAIYKGEVTTWDQVNGTSTDKIQVFTPKSGSGTRSFFESKLTAKKGSAWQASDYAAGFKETQEHRTADIESNPNAIVPFSTARAHYPTANQTAVRLLDGWEAKRAVYNVVREADSTKSEITAIFGADGFLCSVQGKKLIEANGFAQLAAGTCGVGGTAAPTNLATTTVQTATTLTATASVAKSVRLQAKVTSGADGTVKFFEGTSEVGSATPAGGVATKTITATPGEHSYVAKFVSANEAAFTSSESAPAAVTVKAAPAVTITAPASRYGVARNVVVRVGAASSAPVPTGNVTITVAGASYTKALSAGVATVAIPAAVKAGTNVLTAIYAGDAAYGSVTTSGLLVISKATVKLTEAYPAKVKTSTAKGTVKVALNPASTLKPTGTVIVKRGKKVLGKGAIKNGVATIKLKALAKGKNKLVASIAATGNTSAGALKFTITRR